MLAKVHAAAIVGLEGAINNSPARIAEVRETVEDARGMMVVWYLTMGRYDFVSMVAVPDGNMGAKLLLEFGKQGFVETETMRVFTEDEYAQILGGLS